MPIQQKGLKLTAALLSLSFLSSLFLSACHSGTPEPAPSAPAATPANECASVTDADIVKAIAEKVRADVQFKGQLNHIAVNSKGGVVDLLGWAKGEAGVAAIAQYATSTKCVTKVNNLLHSRLTVGCGNDEEDCPNVGCVPLGKCTTALGESGGGNMLPETSSAAMPTAEAKPSPSPSPTPTPKPRRS